MDIDGFEVDQKLWKALRDGQKKSISRALAYLSQPKIAKSCLLSLPTGAGKTGVITVISHISRQRRVLVVSHRSAVRDQLFREISGAFFDKILKKTPMQLKDVYEFSGSPLTKGIHVTTFQKLSRLSPEILDKVKSSVDLIIIDEGHSEPSPIWSQVARGLNAKKIVVTATPYRNDLFAFDINSDFSEIYTFHEAAKKHDLVRPIFEQVKFPDLSSRVHEIFKEIPDAKCIIKCKNFEEIEKYSDIFSKSFKTLSIHQNYVGQSTNDKRASVPLDLGKSDWKIIVHQHKLDEGVDIPQARILILTYPVGSGRELVQAVGRVVRKFESLPSYVLEYPETSNHQMWENYIDFDTYLASPDKRAAFLMSLDTTALLRRYLDAFPDVSYFESSFRRKFDLQSFDVKKSLKIPLASVCFLRKSTGFSLAATTDRIMWDATRAGELVSVRYNQHDMNVVLAVCFRNSRFLDEQLFFEPSLEVMILREFDSFVAVFDSRSRNLAGNQDYKFGVAIDVNALLTLAAREHATRTKEAHAAAISTSSRRPERTSISGRNLEDVGLNQGNSSYALSTIKVDNLNSNGDRKSSYYLSVGSGRVADQMKRNFSLENFNNWLKEISQVIQSPSTNKSTLLGSYAKPIKYIPNTPPISAILDLSEFQAPLEIQYDGKTATIQNNFIYAQYNHGFRFIEADPRLKFELSFDDEEQAILSSATKIQYSSPADPHLISDYQGDFVNLLNDAPLKLLYEDGTSYFNGNFYQISLPSEIGFDLDQSNLGSTIIKIDELQKKGLTEKKEKSVAIDEFDKNSIFFLIDQLKSICNSKATIVDHGPFFPYIANLDTLLCSDMDTEPADFILSSPDKLVFAHVKCGASTDRPQSSAGALAEVGGQAIKNIEVLTSKDKNLKPGNWPIMPKSWPRTGANPALAERIRVVDRARFQNPGHTEKPRIEKLKEVWDTISQRRASPSVSKEIWMVVGNAFSREHFRTQMAKGKNATSESLQAYQLIDSWQSTTSNNDVTLKIFVSP
ncbi:DEAD/DEAH box helicase [Burkholderia pyrrocinia]|uniref:DEAD/DEAH box helicase n=1 Tax=Burkholderia pyrrocinia TaxID=60550 RepID=UPI0010502357|nr:DEAD/DEAH box helicase family protein [Burkholderia pyrrocinia]TDA44923.1 type III restriction endonuclease subunit R [Burkholderia pyrrocinia]